MTLTDEHTAMLTVLLAANETGREVTPGCPDGRSTWHRASRLRAEGLAFLTETDVHRIGAALQRRGLVAHKTLYGVTRWTLTGAGLGQARPAGPERDVMTGGPGLLAVFVGISGSGKSTLAREVFGAASVVSSDALRELVAGDANDQGATREAFDLLHRIVPMRLARQLVTAVDAVSLQPAHRQSLLQLALSFDVPCVAVAMNTPLRICLTRQAGRERQVPDYIIREQDKAYCRALPELPFEGFAAVTAIDGTRSTGHQAAELAEFLARHGGA